MLALRIERARAATDTSPSEAQRAAGNYAKGKVRLHGLTVTIENPKGSVRRGVDPSGKAWESRLACDYGYLNRTQGADGDHVDVFLGPHPESEVVFIVDQVNRAGEFDEHKVVMGCRSEAEARALYLGNYSAGWKVGPITTLTVEQFKRWLAAGNTTRPIEGRVQLVLKAREIKDKPGNVLGVDRRGRAHWLHRPHPAPAWREDFPPVLLQASVHDLYQAGATAAEAATGGKSALYRAAKAGDREAARRVVELLASDPMAIVALGRRYPDAIVAPVRALERVGHNPLPEVFAGWVMAQAGWVESAPIVQTNQTDHRRKSVLLRMASRPTFEGVVIPGRDYVVLDDVVTTGGTLGELRHYIESQGGRVVAALALAGDEQSRHLAPRADVRAQLRRVDTLRLDGVLRDYGVVQHHGELTDSQSRAVLRFSHPDAFGDQLAAAAKRRGSRGGARVLPSSEDDEVGKARRPTPAPGQLGFTFTPRKPVLNPGSHGGHYYRTDSGEVRYGDKPTPKLVIQSKAPPGGWRESDSLRPDATRLAAAHAAVVAAFDQQPAEGQALVLAKLGFTREQWDALPIDQRAKHLLRAIDEAEARRRQREADDAAEKRRIVAAAAEASRPATAKTYATDAHAQPWEVLEHDFLAHAFDVRVRRAERSLESWTRERDQQRGVKRQNAEHQVGLWQRTLDQLKTEGPSPIQMQAWRDEYLKLVKKAISSGKPVPTPVIGQRPEFAKALTARQRYEKGRHTSFANESVAVDRSMQRERGYKVKRQDGKPITSAQVAELQQGIEEIESVLGPLSELFRRSDLTIAHTSGKHPFLKGKAGGLYQVHERTISVGFVDARGRPVAALAHELAHWLDFEAGAMVGVRRTIGRSGRTSRVTTSVAEHDGWSSALIQDARRSMLDTTEVRRLMAAKLSGVDPDTAVKVERARVQLGPYWNEPAEVFARLVEQYITTVRGAGGVASEADYTNKPGYWSGADFARMAPAVAKEIGRRLEILGADPTKVTGQPSHLAEVVRQAGFASVDEAREAIKRDVARAFDVVASKHAAARRTLEHLGDGTPPHYVPADQHAVYRERTQARIQATQAVLAETAAQLEARDPRVPQLSPEVRAGLLNSGADHLTPLVAPEELVAKAGVLEWCRKVVLWAKSLTTAHLPPADPAAPLHVGFFHDGEQWVHGEPGEVEKRAAARRLASADRALRDLYREREALTQTLIHTEEEDVPSAADEMAKAVLGGRCDDLRAEIAALTAVIEERAVA